MSQKQQLWLQTQELLKQHAITLRGENYSEVNIQQGYFEKGLLVNSVGFGKKR